MAHSCPLWTGIPTPLVLGVGELFAKKRSYKERKKSRPSGSVPPAPGASPRAGTPSGVPQLRSSSSSFSRPSGGQDKGGGGSQGAPGG